MNPLTSAASTATPRTAGRSGLVPTQTAVTNWRPLATSSLSATGTRFKNEPLLTPDEREAINGGKWFSSLSPALRHDILRSMFVRRYTNGQLIAARGDTPANWMACAKGAVRVSSTSISGKQITLTYVEPGIWFGDTALCDGETRTHDAYAHGDTALVCVAESDFRKILSMHPELYEAILRLHAKRIRQLFGLVEDLNTLTLRSRLAKQLLHLVRSYGVASLSENPGIRIGLRLAQEELAQLVGAVRQRINLELKIMEREGVITIEPGGLVIRDAAALKRISLADDSEGGRQAASHTISPP